MPGADGVEEFAGGDDFAAAAGFVEESFVEGERPLLVGGEAVGAKASLREAC